MLLTQTADFVISCNKNFSRVNNALRKYKLLDEEVLPSKNDELTCSLVEPSIRVVDGRYEMPVRFKPDVLKKLPNNYDICVKANIVDASYCC